jgi:predicted amidohydrolase YtcJ
VANSAALKIAKIDQHTPNPFGGQILKTDGEPTECCSITRMDLVAQNIPPPTEAEREQA